MGIFKSEKLKQEAPQPKRHDILMVDDDPENLRAFSLFLSKEYNVVGAIDGLRALEIIEERETPFHLIISDQRMPHLSGVEFLEQTIQLMPKAKRIILSGYTDADVILASVNRARIHEFLVKPVERNKLLLTVRRALEAYDLEESNLRLVHDLQLLNSELEAKVSARTRELEELNERLEAMATTDQLTGAFNRRKFDEIIEAELRAVARYKEPLSLIIFDLDHFKRVNDAFGHLVGDDVLRELVQQVKSNSRPRDCLIRWGGEEFLIVLPHTELAGATALAEILRERIESVCFAVVEKLTISAGVTEFRPDEGPDQFISRCDQALYLAKHQGRNQVVAL